MAEVAKDITADELANAGEEKVVVVQLVPAHEITDGMPLSQKEQDQAWLLWKGCDPEQ